MTGQGFELDVQKILDESRDVPLLDGEWEGLAFVVLGVVVVTQTLRHLTKGAGRAEYIRVTLTPKSKS